MLLKKKNLLLLFLIGIFIIGLHYFKVLSPLEGLIVRGLNPIRRFIYSTSNNFKSYFYIINHYDTVKSENENLKNKLRDYVVEVSRLKKLEEENSVLKQELNYFESGDKKLVLAEVVSNFYEEGNALLVINKGSQSGISIGSPVVFASGIIVGKVIKVDDWSADVLLLSNKNSSLTAMIQNDNKVNGIVQGDVNFSLEMNYIPSDLNVQNGDIVVTAGLEEKIPRALVIGQVKEIFFKDGDFFKKAMIYPLVDYQKMNFVSVIID